MKIIKKLLDNNKNTENHRNPLENIENHENQTNQLENHDHNEIK